MARKSSWSSMDRIFCSLTNKNGNLVLTYVGGKLLESTNVTGPWTTNATMPAGAVTINPTGHMKFYLILTNTAWE